MRRRNKVWTDNVRSTLFRNLSSFSRTIEIQEGIGKKWPL